MPALTLDRRPVDNRHGHALRVAVLLLLELAGVPIRVNDIWEAHVAVNYKDTGHQETYTLTAQDWDTAARDALAVAEARSLLLGKGAWIEWVDVRQPLYPSPMLPLLQDRIYSLRDQSGQHYWQAPDHGGTVLNVSWFPAGAKGYHRAIRYLADDQFVDNEWIHHGLEIPEPTIPRPVDFFAVAPTVLYQYAMGRIRDLTCLAKRLPDPAPGVPQWMLHPYHHVKYGRKGSWRVRPAWYRVSWEWADFEHAAAFSPCGCAVGVRRSTYVADCQPYAGGQVNRIRYYYAQSGARILPFRNIFHPEYGIEDYTNPGGPGELSGRPVEDWTPGFGWSMAPGLAPTGTARDFLGMSEPPFDEAELTPLSFLPECDVPTPLPLVIDDDPNTFTETNARQITLDGQTMRGEIVAPGHVKLFALIPPPSRYVAQAYAIASLHG